MRFASTLVVLPYLIVRDAPGAGLKPLHARPRLSQQCAHLQLGSASPGTRRAYASCGHIWTCSPRAWSCLASEAADPHASDLSSAHNTACQVNLAL